ncbi:ABC transporter substrate-binding protein [Motiliproteus sp. SC1-56]|uniref:ABC transporter substrate-binding protein n=1 Tax=Motiliproteus sp. SC1-56 TaxID=2799565 RepID=UPI001A90324B|nr:ABC transporter substrate-binding protein [Motiliproteus sp. SC1-56]
MQQKGQSTASAKGSVLLCLLSCAILLFAPWSAAENAALRVQVGYLELLEEQPPLLSNVLPEPRDRGLQGARLGIADNNAGGRFLGQQFELLNFRSDSPNALIERLDQWVSAGVSVVVANLPAPLLSDLAQRYSTEQLLLFNAGSADNALRSQQCLANVLHTLPSRAMLTDALGQWLTQKKLRRWLVVEGARPADQEYVQSLQRTAQRYGSKIVARKRWRFDSDLRRSAQREVPLFTQAGDYDAVVVADELGDFGEFLLYNTWLPRPVVGTQGLTPVAWHRVVEQWGAAQLQRRFDRQAGRWMSSVDYAAWAAVRSVGEAVAAVGQTDAGTLRQHLLSDGFQLGGFKGRKLSYRPWNGQLRQPIALVHPRALVSQSPQEGFLHPQNELDTLGFDRPESQCQDLLAGARR